MNKVLIIVACCMVSLTSIIKSSKANLVNITDSDGYAVLVQGPGGYQVVRTTVSGHYDSQFTTGDGSLDMHFSQIDEYGDPFYVYPTSYNMASVTMGTTIYDFGGPSIKYGGYWPLSEVSAVQLVAGTPYEVNTDSASIFIPDPYS